MVKRITYYQQLKLIVLPYVKYYIEDFTKWDREILLHDDRAKAGHEFLFAIRETGTNIFTLEREFYDNDRQLFKHFMNRPFLLSSNKRFFHGKNGNIEEITKAESEQIIFDKFCFWFKTTKDSLLYNEKIYAEDGELRFETLS